MTVEWVQDWTVTLIAAVAAMVILRRVIALVQPSKGGIAGCSSCASGRKACPESGHREASAKPVQIQVLRGQTVRHPSASKK
jgi:hypothetical protein